MSLTSLADQWMKLKNHPALLFLLAVFLLPQSAKLVHQAAAQIHARAQDRVMETKAPQKGERGLLYTMLGLVICHISSGWDSQNNSNPSKMKADELLPSLC